MTKTLSGAEHDQMLRFYDVLRAALNAASKERWRWPDVTTTRYGDEPAWAGKERELLNVLVNDRRAELDGEPVSADEVYAVEQSASGHSDYAAKFTLRLAMLAYGVEWKP
jgi:hypothetical protein